MSNNWKDSSKGETYSSLDDINDETLRTKMVEFMEKKSTEPLEYNGYYVVANSWVQKDKETKQPVLKDGKEVWNKFVYRFNKDEKEKAIEKSKPYVPKSGGGKGNYKPNITTFKDPNKVRVDDTPTRETLQKNGYHILPYSLTGRPAIFEDMDADGKPVDLVWYGSIYSIEL